MRLIVLRSPDCWSAFVRNDGRVPEGPDDQSQVRALAARYLAAQRSDGGPQRVLVVLCGVTHSGKSTLARRDPGLSALTHVEADGMRNLIARRHHDLRRAEPDEPSPFGLDAPGPSPAAGATRAQRGSILRELTDAVFEQAFADGLGLLHDASNKAAGQRRARLDQARAAGYRTAVLEVTCPDDVVLQRLSAHDDALAARGLEPMWMAEHARSHACQFEPPSADEADEVLAVPFDAPVPIPLQCLQA